MVSFDINDRKKIGLGLTGFGVLFSFLGILMLFDKGFLAMGNILFVSGVSLTIGLKSTVQFFTKPKNHKGSIAFGIGLFLVLIGWPVFGMMAESYGFAVLFRNLWVLYLTATEFPHSGFWPTAAVYLQKNPTVGWIFQHPYVTSSPLFLVLTDVSYSNFAVAHPVQRQTSPRVIAVLSKHSQRMLDRPV
ncbi:putative Golgi transport protein 1 [Triticum urartu]|uniref:Putative Golgi transport protein 1 n=2 Tax=Triticum TaxID=4564 RepID=M7Z3B7_TRIUA|nr:putative Golgi transport protein 1 [Triticum urartu]